MTANGRLLTASAARLGVSLPEFRKYPEAGETCCRSTLSRDPANTGIPRDLNSNSRQYRDRAWGAGLEALLWM
ncbi:hypothetical protein EVAR_67043_1 [Eumeta japonica]|uniref:Uncharacterized protein n=1 Tax=Eumeta variegata TaxID=151549 RepID=A0A4C1ZRD3_EUMVA|nr:hypothetical protein EVAR_67043_1 [Eumeta japonica]